MSSNKKYFILYDLETSSKDFIGQILTAYFILVDEDFNPIPNYELDLKVQISRLELPHPEAILVNRIHVLQHQKESISEYDACQKIQTFIQNCIEFAPPKRVKLMGYNSSRFDLPFIRTTFIRNGFNPYFFGKLLYSDGLYLVRKIAWEHPDFPKIIVKNKELTHYSYSLENLCKHFGLLEGDQTHSAKDDVLIFLDLLKTVQEQFQTKLWDEEEFNLPDTDIFFSKEFDVHSFPQYFKLNEYFVLDKNKTSCLLVDIEQFRKDPSRDAIRYKNKSTGFLISTEEHPTTITADEKQMIQYQFQEITCDNFFPVTDCDIEQDIYRLSFAGIKDLRSKIHGKKADLHGKQDLRQLWRRYNLKTLDPKDYSNPTHFYQALTQYVEMRYTQKVKLNKFGDQDRLSESWDDLQEVLSQKLENASPKDDILLQALAQLYEQSDIKKVLDSDFSPSPL
ncbi:MAG: hypothetical protein ACI86H_002424 [bacterium]|jgi:hypothetical protein